MLVQFVSPNGTKLLTSSEILQTKVINNNFKRSPFFFRSREGSGGGGGGERGINHVPRVSPPHFPESERRDPGNKAGYSLIYTVSYIILLQNCEPLAPAAWKDLPHITVVSAIAWYEPKITAWLEELTFD